VKKIVSCAAVVGLLVASSSSVFAGGGASQSTPAYASSHPGSSTLTAVPGRSGPSAYAPGQQMQAGTLPTGATANGHGASVWAPGFLK
jgi:hypothetical protein